MNWCTLEQSLREVISQGSIQPVFQPIVDIQQQKVLGYEALTRGPSDSSLYSAGVLFETAERAGLLDSLEYLCRRKSAERYKQLCVDGLLFVNVTPQTLETPIFSSEGLDRLLLELDINPENVVLELSERYPATDISQTLKSLELLRKKGFKIAIDDLGAGYSGLKLWSEVKPDYVKIDRHFIRDIDTDLVKREFVSSVIQLANGMSCKLIAEGVETESEVKTVHNLGIKLCQGFYFGKPKPVPVVSNLTKLNQLREESISLGKVGSLSTYITPITPKTSLGEVAKRFAISGYVSSIPVVDDRKPVGMISKWSLLELFSLPFGRALHENKPIEQYMAHNPIVVAWDEDLSEVSRLLTEEEDLYIRQHFIITRRGQYHGLGSTRDVLKRITDMKIRSARYANPLTLLPGNVPINEKINELEQSKKPYSLAYFDIDHFKPLNDVLGYSTGDLVIQLLANTLKSRISDETAFIGHIGGDDFVVIFELSSAATNELDEGLDFDLSVGVASICQQVQQDYQHKVIAHYPKDAVKLGYICAPDRSGLKQAFPLSTLSVGVVEQDMPGETFTQDMSSLAAKAKKQAKQAKEKMFTMRMSEHQSSVELECTGSTA